MQSQRRRVIWPYLALLASLFALSVTAPRSWQADRGPSHGGVPRTKAQAASGRQSSASRRRAAAPPKDVTDWPGEVPSAPVQAIGFVGQRGPEPAEAATSLAGKPASGYDPRRDGPSPPSGAASSNGSRVASHRDAPAIVAALEPPEPPPVTPTIDEVCPMPWLPDESLADLAAGEPANGGDDDAAGGGLALAPTLPAFAGRMVEGAIELANTPLPRMQLPEINLPWPAIADGGAAGRWPASAALAVQFESLAAIDEASGWVGNVSSRLRALQDEAVRTSASSLSALSALRGALEETSAIEARLTNAVEIRAVRRARYALERRLDVWDLLAAAAAEPPAAEPPDAAQLSLCLAEFDKVAIGTPAGAAWREYLLVDQLRGLTAATPDGSRDEARRIARRVLGRLDAGRLSSEQFKFTQDQRLSALANELARWAAEPVAAVRLLEHIEAYEASGSASDARRLAEDWRHLSWSSREEDRALAEQLAVHWRNANVRVAVSQSLLNRLVPPPRSVDSPVHDTILGARVQGRSTTIPKLFVRLIPDRQKVRLGLEASGMVESDTAATSGGATFYSAGESSFALQKQLVFGPQGLRVMPAEGHADVHYDQLKSVETDYDGVPLLGPFARLMAQSQHDEKRPRIRQESEARLASRARQQFDAEIHKRLAKLNGELDRQVLARLVRLGLEPATIDASTAGERAVVRMRVAAANQLGAHTPRPQAPADSQLSLQLHESAINNMLERLELDGRTFELPGLFQWINDKLDRVRELPDDLPDDVRIRFADHDSIRIRCQNDRLELTLSLAELSQRKTRWRNFTVVAQYQLESHGLEPCLVREGPISLDGPSLRGRPQVVLRTIFSKVLSKSRHTGLIDEKLAADPRFNGLAINQLVLDEGWLGIAVGPDRAARTAGRPSGEATQ